MTRPDSRRPARGFTLVELLVVIVILAILVALLIPAVTGAIRKTRGAAVQAEINQMAQALADFKSKYGDYPPSRVLLSENGYLNTTNTTPLPTGSSADITVGQLAQRSISALRKFWPRVVMSTTGPVFAGGSTAWYDFNGDATFQADATGGSNAFANVPTSFYLQGHECLVFFLGGIPVTSGPVSGGGVVSGVSGFAKDPVNPFKNATATTNRTPPLFDFNPGRLRVANAHGLPGYIDSFNGTGNNNGFYVYFSTNLGTGYDPNDYNRVDTNQSSPNAAETDNNGVTPLTLLFRTSFPVYPSGGGSATNQTSSPTPNPYTSSLPGGASTTAVAFQNPQSFQILAPGADGLYGVGGIYTPTGTSEVLPAEHSSATPAANQLSNSADSSLRVMERDNLTNFHNGTLD